MKNQLLEEIEDLKNTIDQTTIQTALNTVRIGVLQSALLGICEVLLSSEDYKRLCSNYLSELKQSTDDALERLDDVLYNPAGKVLKAKMDNHLQTQSMKRNLGVAD